MVEGRTTWDRTATATNIIIDKSGHQTATTGTQTTSNTEVATTIEMAAITIEATATTITTEDAPTIRCTPTITKKAINSKMVAKMP